jgi:hypothetical protein
MNNIDAYVHDKNNVLLRSLGTTKHFGEIEEQQDQYRHKGTWQEYEANPSKNLITKADTNDSIHNYPTPMGE